MQIHRVNFRGFGCWVEREFIFHKGINVIEAPNERGKSTLIQGIFALLYGSKKEGVKKQTKSDWYDRYIPWVGHQYGGEVDYSIHNHTYRLVRVLFLPQNTMQLICLQQAMDITSQFPMDRKKDRLFLEKQIGFSGESLKRIIFLASQSLMLEKDETEQQAKVIEKMKSIFYGQDVDMQLAVQTLDKNLHKIGTLKQGNKRLGGAFLRCSELEDDLKSLKRDYNALMEDIAHRSQIERKKQQLQRQKQELERDRQRIDVALRRYKLQEIDRKIEQLRQQYKSLDLLIEEEAYEKIRMLEEFEELEVRSLQIDDFEQNPLLGDRLTEDIERLSELEIKEVVAKRRKQELEIRLQRSVQSSPKGWSITVGVLSLLIGVVLVYWLRVFSFFSIGTGFCILAWYFVIRKKAHKMKEQKENMEQEFEEIQLLKMEILKRWYADSLTTLHKIQKSQIESSVNHSNFKEQRLEQIHHDVKKWLTVFLKELPLFHPKQWIREIRLLLHQAKEINEMLCQLEMKKSSIHKERPYYELYRGLISKEMESVEYNYQTIEEELATIKAEQARLDGKIEKTSEFVSILSQKETEWEAQKREVAILERERKSILLAKEVLLEVASEMHANMGSELIPYASEWLRKVTDNRYSELLMHLHQELQLHVFIPETGESQPISVLSRGTIEQVVLSLRLALLQVYADRVGVFLPLILDDCFAHYDEDRLESALQILESFADKGHQIIICTCHERERVKMERLMIPFQLIYI